MGFRLLMGFISAMLGRLPDDERGNLHRGRLGQPPTPNGQGRLAGQESQQHRHNHLPDSLAVVELARLRAVSSKPLTSGGTAQSTLTGTSR